MTDVPTDIHPGQIVIDGSMYDGNTVQLYRGTYLGSPVALKVHRDVRDRDREMQFLKVYARSNTRRPTHPDSPCIIRR